MRPVTIPKAHRRSIERLSQIEQSAITDVATQLGEMASLVEQHHVITMFAEATGCTVDEASTLVDALIGAHGVRAARGLSVDEAARQVAGSPMLDLDDGSRKALVERLRPLLEAPSLALLSRTIDLLREDQNSYCRSRIITDLRPIFGPESDPAVTAGFVHHSLKLNYHVGAPETEAIVVSMDERALRQLQANVVRALRKADALKRVARNAELTLIDTEEVH